MDDYPEHGHVTVFMTIEVQHVPEIFSFQLICFHKQTFLSSNAQDRQTDTRPEQASPLFVLVARVIDEKTGPI